jgi:hypothetical protein
MKITFIITALLISIISLNVSAQSGSSILKKGGEIRFAKGYIDDKFAICPLGKTLAYVSVKSVGTANLHIRNLSKGTEKVLNITKFTNEPHDLRFVSPNLVAVSVKKGKYFTFGFYDLSAILKGQISGVTDLIIVDGKITTYKKVSGTNRQVHTVKTYALSDVKKELTSSVLRGDVRGRVVKKPDAFDISFFTPDYKVAIVKIIGKYDKKSDSKIPDRNGTYEMATKKLVIGKSIANTSLWDKEAYTFFKNPGVSNIIDIKGSATVSGISGKFRISVGANQWKKINPKFKLGRFEFDTFHQEKRVSNSLNWFSFMIDPQNPITLKNLKSEKRFIHFFTVDSKTGNAVDVGRVIAKDGVVSWKRGGDYIALMRLSKNWMVGSETLELYKIK